MASSKSRFRIPGAVIAVTGASAGIGAATARRLAAEGAALALLARRTDRLEELRRTLADPGRHRAIACDVTQVRSVTQAFGDAAAGHGRLDAVVLNAGIGAFARVDATTEEALRAVVETNLCGVVRCIREAVPFLRGARDRVGRIVLVSSVAGRRGFPHLGVYSATKAALHALADALRVELAADGIRTSIVAPGRTDTEFVEVALGSPPAPDGPPGTRPERIAEAIAAALETAPVECYRGRPGRLIALANLLFPRWFDRRMRRFVQ